MHYELEREVIKRKFTTVALYFLSSVKGRTYVGRNYFYTPEFDIGQPEPLSPTATELLATQCLAILHDQDTIVSTLDELPAKSRFDLAQRVRDSANRDIRDQWTVN